MSKILKSIYVVLIEYLQLFHQSVRRSIRSLFVDYLPPSFHRSRGFYRQLLRATPVPSLELCFCLLKWTRRKVNSSWWKQIEFLVFPIAYKRVSLVYNSVNSIQFSHWKTCLQRKVSQCPHALRWRNSICLLEQETFPESNCRMYALLFPGLYGLYPHKMIWVTFWEKSSLIFKYVV